MINCHNRKFGYNIKPTHPYDEKRCSDETRKRMSKSFWNNRNPKNHSEWLSSKFKGRKAPWKARKQIDKEVEKRIKRCRKPVIQCDLEGNKIKEWISAKDVERTLGWCSDYISLACRGKIAKFKNHIWKYQSNHGCTKKDH